MSLTIVKLAVMPDIKEYVTIEDAAGDERVPYTAYWLRRLAQESKIQATKVGKGARGQWLIHLPSLLKYIKEMEMMGTKKHNPHE
jgi:hypothetical protein